MVSGVSSALDAMVQTMLAMDTGIGLLVGVGISMSASHLFALLANRLTPRQIAIHLVVDGLGLSLALTLGILSHSLMLLMLQGVPPQPILLANRMSAAFWPGLFYVLVAAPYVSDLIAVTLLGWMHLNVLLLLEARYGVPLHQGLLISAPGFALALVLIALLFAQRWRASYNTLAREVGG